MASNNNGYYGNYYGNQQQQSYGGYQTAPASNAIQSSTHSNQQFQQQSVPATTQAADYMNYQTHSYNAQGTGYGSQQDGSWGSNYGNNRESTRGAAEVLRNLSNSTYGSSSNTAVSSPAFTPTNAATAPRYSANAAQNQKPQVHNDSRVSSAQSMHSSYGQSQPRPRSVNATHGQPSTTRGHPSPAVAAGYPSQRVQAAYNLQQRSASPAQTQYSHNTGASAATNRTSNLATASQYNDYNRMLPSVTDTSRPSQTAATTNSYSYSDRNITASAAHTARSTSIADTYEQPAITVDPMAVYDPWPEYQRQQEALRKQKAAEDARRAEENRKADEVRRVEDDRKKAEEEQRAAEERRAREEREAEVPVPLPATEKQKKPKKRAPKPKSKDQASAAALAVFAAEAQVSDGGAGTELEAEIRAIMAKMRQLNNKDPALLARIWEEERKTKVGGKSPTVQSQPAPQPAAQGSASNARKAQAGRSRTSKQGQTPKITNNVPKSPHAPIAAPARPPSTTPAVSTPPQSKGSTIWPAEKKSQLAAAAANYLNTWPENANKTLSGDQVCQMLDSNPSYIELCEILEGRGLKLDRAAFAKNLLAAVPDVNSASRQAQAQVNPIQRPPVQPQSTAQVNGTAAQNAVVPRRSIPTNGARPTAAAVSQMDVDSPYPSAVQAPYYSSPYPPFPDDDISASQSPAPIAQMLPNFKHEAQKETPNPANKEEAARKRNFSDMIDLTLLSEDEVGPPPQKKAQGEGAFSFSPSGSAPPSAVDNHQNFASLPPPTPVTMHPVAPMYSGPSLPLASGLRSANIVGQIERRKALRRSTYNIKTIARDILLACGRHPKERQLNAHLDALKESFPQVNNDSDLSTLRWDILDPGEPPKGYYKDKTAIQEPEDADDEDSSDEDERSLARPSVAVQQTVGVGGGGESTSRFEHPSYAPLKGQPKRRGRPPRHSYPTMSRPYGFEDGEVQNSPAGRSGARRGGHSAGRNSIPYVDASRDTLNPSSTPKSTMSAPRSTEPGTGYSAFRQTHTEDGTPLPKKRGRPVGWRKNIHGSEAAQARVIDRSGPRQPSGLRNVDIPSRGTVVEINSRSPSVANPNRPRAPKYLIFKCEWEHCQAQLHNLETLRKHVHKRHGQLGAKGGYECSWADCGHDVQSLDPATGMRVEQHQRFHFNDNSGWREHLETKHFKPISWKFGDGPTSGLSDAHESASESYLSDNQGRQVTPRISVDPDRMSIDEPDVHRRNPDNPASLSAPRRGRPPKSKTDKHVEAQNGAQTVLAHKRQVGGTGFEVSGALLVNEKRRKGLGDNEDDDEQIVDSED